MGAIVAPLVTNVLPGALEKLMHVAPSLMAKEFRCG